MVATLPNSPDQTKRLRLSPLQFLNLNQSLLENFIGNEGIQNIVKIHQVGNPTKAELEAHESHLYTKEALGITKPVVAISGTVASGKTTTITHLCHKLQYELIDNGSLFRAIAYYLDKEGYVPHENGVDFLKKDGSECSLGEVEGVITNMGLQYSYESFDDGKGEIKILIGEEDVSKVIRSKTVSKIVPSYGGNQLVMDSVLGIVTKICKETPKDGVVIGSRGYGVFVLSDADYIFHMDADIPTRLQRSAGGSTNGENQKGVTSESIEEFTIRDIEDIIRENGSLRVSNNAKIINTGNGTVEEISEIMVRYIRQMERKKILTKKIANAKSYAELVPIAMEMIDSYIKSKNFPSKLASREGNGYIEKYDER